jgi:hypothetical protein
MGLEPWWLWHVKPTSEPILPSASGAILPMPKGDDRRRDERGLVSRAPIDPRIHNGKANRIRFCRPEVRDLGRLQGSLQRLKGAISMLFGQLALVVAAAFAGAAFYINFAEHPARLTLNDSSLLKQWKPSYDAGYTMQATLAALSAALGLLAAWSSADRRWIVGAVLIFANWPYTLLCIRPTNNRLKAIAETDAGPTSRALLLLWGRLHAVRTALGLAAALAYLWAGLR